MSSSFHIDETPRTGPVQPTRGKLKVFLGYAAGVGKTYQMLEEGQELTRQGVDVVVGYFEPHGRPDTIAKLQGLEVVPPKSIEYRQAAFQEMDAEAILRRRPAVCLVDEFPHSNVPGSERSKRWEDVLFLLDQKIDVLTTMNVQHLESLNDQVYQITGIRMRETVPDWVIQQADEVVMVDLTPRALLNRLERGVVYQGDKAQLAKENFFRESTLVALRELALRETAFEVESRHNSNLDDRSINIALKPAAPERILVYLTPEPASAALIRRGKRVADYMHGECLAVAMRPSEEQREALERNLAFARNLHVRSNLLTGRDAAHEIVSFARNNGVTQIYLGRPRRTPWDLPFTRGLVQRVARLARDMEVTIVAERAPSSAKNG